MEFIRNHFADRVESMLWYKNSIEDGEGFEGGLDIKDGEDIWMVRLRLRKKKRK